METRAPYIIVSALVLSAIATVFGFVYWLNNAGGIGKRDTYHVVFNGPVPGLLVGAGVLFNGIRVGEVTSLDLVAERPMMSTQRSQLPSIHRCLPTPGSASTFRD